MENLVKAGWRICEEHPNCKGCLKEEEVCPFIYIFSGKQEAWLKTQGYVPLFHEEAGMWGLFFRGIGGMLIPADELPDLPEKLVTHFK